MVEDELAALRARFSKRTLEEATRLMDYLEQGDLAMPEIEKMAHRLAGTGGTLGFAELSAAAAAVEDRFAVGETPTREQIETLLAAMETLRTLR